MKRAIAQGHRQRIAVAVVQWSDDANQKIVLPWTIVAGDADADELGLTLSAMNRQLAGGRYLDFNRAHLFGRTLRCRPLGRAPGDRCLLRRPQQHGPPVAPVRDRLVAQGITINGLTILNEWPTLDTYFENNVAGGTGYFVIPANDYNAYAEAIFRKLLREITGPGIT